MIGFIRENKALYLLIVVSSLISGLASSILAPYLRGAGLDASHYGLFAANMAIGSLIGGLIGGFLSDYIGSRKLIFISSLLATMGYVIISINGVNSLMVAAVVLGVAGGTGGVAFLMLVLRAHGVDDEIEEPIVAFQATSMIATSLGMLLGWFPVVIALLTDIDINAVYRGTLFASGITSFLLILLLLSRVPEGRGGSRQKAIRYHADTVEDIDWKSIGKLLIANILISFGAGLSVHIIDFYFTKKFGFDSGRLGTVMSLQNLLMGAGMILAKRISQELGSPLKTYIIISSSSVPLLISMTFIDSAFISSMIYIIRTFLMNIANPLYQAFELSLVPDRYRGRFIALLNVIQVVPAALGRAIGGWLMTFDLELPLRLTAIIYLIAFIFLAVGFPKFSPKPDDIKKIGSLIMKTLTPITRLQRIL